MAEVVLDRVSKVYEGNVQAVNQVSLEIPDGLFVVLVGPSGCGKSTTLRMVAGLEEITEGTITIGGRVVNEISPKDRDIAMVFQNYALYPHMTVYRNMAFGLKLRDLPRKEIDTRVRQAADLLGIEPLLQRKPRALSGGQRQRVALGRAIVRDPAVFLFDEPLSNLDAKLRVQTRAELKRLHVRLSTTTLYVTHDQEEAMTLGDLVVVMNGGVIQQAASPLEVYQRPANRFVAAFVGTPPMNFFEGQVRPDGDRLFFHGEGFRLRLPETLAHAATFSDSPDMVLGVRPEAMHLRPTREASHEDQTIPLAIGVIEPLGGQMDVHGTTPGGQTVTARVRAEALAPQARVSLYLSEAGMHLFEPGETGRAIGTERVTTLAAS